MLLPEKTMSEIAAELLAFNKIYYEGLTPHQEGEFYLLCKSWEERTGNSVSFDEMKNIKQVYGE